VGCPEFLCQKSAGLVKVIASVLVSLAVVGGVFFFVGKSEKSSPEEETASEAPVSYQIENVPYYVDETADQCYLVSAMVLLKHNGFSEEEVQKYKNFVIEEGRGGPPDIMLGFEEFGLGGKVRLGYSSRSNPNGEDLYKSFLNNPTEQAETFETRKEAFTKLKDLLATDHPVEVIIRNGNHHVVVTGYDEENIYINDSNPELGGPQVMKTEDFLAEWNLSGDTHAGIRFPGDWSMVWLAKEEAEATVGSTIKKKLGFLESFFRRGARLFQSPKTGIPRTDDIPDNPASEVCLKITQPEDVYYCLAVANQDGSFCEKMDLPGQKNLCLAMAKGDVSYCRKISDPAPKKMCYYELSFATGNIDYCSEVQSGNECYDAYIHRLHWESRGNEIKAGYCEKLSADAAVLRDCCQAFRKQDPSFCHGNKYCLSYFEQPLSFCETPFKAPSGKTKDKGDCLLDRALSAKDSSLCAKIEDTEVRDICYSNYSTHIEPDLSLCEKIADEMMKNMCYAEYAINLAEK